MYKMLRKNFLTLVLLSLVHINSTAQESANYPYSRYGLGSFNDINFAALRSMGGIATAFSDPYYTNLSNPASLASLRATSFEVGFDVNKLWLTDDATSSSATYNGGNLNYFSLAFPLINPVNRLLDRRNDDFNMAMGFGLVPHSRVSHFTSMTEEIAEVGRVFRESEGSGGLNKVLWSNAIGYKKFSFGLSLGYLFGNIRKEFSDRYQDMPLAFANYSLSSASYRGFVFNTGAQYHLDLSDGKGLEDSRDIKMLTFGLSTSASTKFRTVSTDFVALKGPGYGGLADDVPDEETDTISYREDLERFGKLPGDLKFGLVYRRGTKLTAGMDYSFYSGSKYENDLDQDKLANGYRIALGFQYIPDFTSLTNYFERVSYRGGVNFGTDPREVMGNQIKRMQINAGIGLPVVVSRQLSFINFGIEYNRFGGDLPVSQSQLGFNVGVTLNNNLWFLKRKFD